MGKTTKPEQQSGARAPVAEAEPPQEMIRGLVSRIRRTIPVVVPEEYLMAAALAGYQRAVRNYERQGLQRSSVATLNVSFAAYARCHVRGSILESLRHVDCSVLDLMQLAQSLNPPHDDAATPSARLPRKADPSRVTAKKNCAA